jgi:nucleotide-binding universal stress UspA family protein
MADLSTAPRVEGTIARRPLMTTPAGAPILLCYDGSAGSVRAIETAAALFPGREAIVLHVWSPIGVIAAAYAGGMVSLPAYDDDELRHAATEVAARGARAAAAAGLAAKAEVAEVTFDGTAQAILSAADRHEAKVIVLGARGLSAFKSALLGSVSHGVAQHAHRAVLIVPPASGHERRSESAGHATASV